MSRQEKVCGPAREWRRVMFSFFFFFNMVCVCVYIFSSLYDIREVGKEQ